MRDVLLKDRDVRELSERVKELSFSINVEFPPRISEGNVRKLFVEDIEKFKENNNIIVHPSGDEPDFPEGLDIEIDLDESINGKSKAHLIIINDAVLHLPDGALSRGLKETLLHEFSHLILKHPGVLIPPDEYDSPDVLSTMMWNYVQFLHNEKVRNFDAELMALVLGFWPAAEFTRLFKANRASMREIANEYKMTVYTAIICVGPRSGCFRRCVETGAAHSPRLFWYNTTLDSDCSHIACGSYESRDHRPVQGRAGDAA